jgi:uncharacterized protein YjiK
VRRSAILGGFLLAVLLAIAVAAGAARSASWPSTSPSVLADYAIAKGGDARWELPATLREISGLAATPDGRVFAHADERALIVELDVPRQRAVKAFAMGRQGVRGDFEGIAVADGRFWLVTSDGILYESGEGQNGGYVAFRTYDTGVGTQCEVEGLAYDPTAAALLLACKTPRARALRGLVAVFAWSIPRRALVTRNGVRVQANALARSAGVSTFHPSGLERDPTTGHWLLLAARERAVVEITPDGGIVAGAALSRRGHRQAEGIAVASDRTLLIGDEGAGRLGTLTVYRHAR